MSKRLLVIIGAGLTSVLALAEGTPKIQFDQAVFDIGTTGQVKAVAGKFTFRNAGDGVLKLQKPTTSCGCTVASITPDTYRPGEKGELSFTVNLSNVRGPFHKQITVPSNDPQNPTASLSVKADVKPTFEVVPPQFMLGDIKRGDTAKATVEVKRLDGMKLAITKTEAAQDFITTKTAAQPVEFSDGKIARITLEAKAGDRPRRFYETLRVYTDESPEPVLLIPVVGRVLGDVALQPEALTWLIQDPANWPAQNPETMTTRRLRVTATRAQPVLELQNAKSSITELTVDIVTINPGQSFELVAKLTKSPKESMQAVISFESNSPTQPKIEVPVMITVLGAAATGHNHAPAK